MRILLLSCGGPFGARAFDALDGDHEVVAIVGDYGRSRRPPLLGEHFRGMVRRFVRGLDPARLDDVALRRSIPSWWVRDWCEPRLQARLRSLSPELICIASLNRILPPEILGMGRQGVLNLHPSLLPAYRGPSPIFWAIRDDCETTGVTVHAVDEGCDTGPISGQEKVEILDRTATELIGELAATGGRLLARVVQGVAEGRLSVREQGEASTSFARNPRAEDRDLDPTWTVGRTVRFRDRLGAWLTPTVRSPSGERWPVGPVTRFETGVSTADREVVVRRGEIEWPCADGVVTLRRSSESSKR